MIVNLQPWLLPALLCVVIVYNIVRGLVTTRKVSVKALDMCLIYAAAEGSIDLVRKWLDVGARTNVTNSEHTSALMAAAQAPANSAAITGILLKAGADAMLKDQNGHLALHFASALGRTDVMELLLPVTSKKDSRNYQNMTPLMLAVYAGNTAGVHLLLKAGAKPNVRDIRGRTALHWACIRGHGAAVVALLQYTAQGQIEDTEGRTCLSWACILDRADIADTLLSTMNLRTTSGELGRMAKHQLWQTLASKDEEGRNPLQWTTSLGHTKVADVVRPYHTAICEPTRDERRKQL